MPEKHKQRHTSTGGKLLIDVERQSGLDQFGNGVDIEFLHEIGAVGIPSFPPMN